MSAKTYGNGYDTVPPSSTERESRVLLGYAKFLNCYSSEPEVIYDIQSKIIT